MTTTHGPKMRTSDALRALADQLDALGDILDHPITATIYDFGFKHEVTMQPFGDNDQRDAALVYAIAAKLGAEIGWRTLDEAKVSVEFATKFSGVELAMFSHVDRKAADRAARDAYNKPPTVTDMRQIFSEPVEGHDYDVMPPRDSLGGAWQDPAVRRAVRETIAESEADR